ncbi:MAG TPA: alpha/beta hydrolase [Allosphingosinicella sp.]|jgi:pimeloyl-ACP methyl ester carboxylesterase
MRPLKIFAALFLLLFAGSQALATEPAAPRFTVTVQGSGPDVILIPGLASSTAVWNATAERLRARFRVHLVQVAGFAGAPVAGNAEGLVVAPLAEALAAYIAENRLRAPAVIGHSLGGETALMLAARHPEAVGRIMAVDSLPFYSLLFNPAATVESVRPQADAMRAALLAQTDEQAAAAADASMARLVRTESARAAPTAWGRASDRGVVARAIHELITTDLRPELGRIRAPLTVLYAWDPLYGVPAEAIDGVFRSAYANAPGATLQRIDGSFHFIMVDQPEAFAAAVDRFLQ